MASVEDIKRECIDARDRYIALIKDGLLGPGSEVSIPDKEHEIISSSPENRYSIGVLYPQDIKVNADNDDLITTAEEPEEDNDINDSSEKAVDDTKGSQTFRTAYEDNLDEEISMATQNYPSSMGFTFLASHDLRQLKCSVDFATYRRAKVEDCRVPLYPDSPEEYAVPDELSEYVYFDKNEKCLRPRVELIKKSITDLKGNLRQIGITDESTYGIFDAMFKLCDQLTMGYVRVPHHAEETVTFPDGVEYVDENKGICGTSAKLTALKHRLGDGSYSLTIMMVNGDEGDVKKSRGMRCIFQPRVTVSSDDNGFEFKEYQREFASLDAEEQSLELQYRNKKTYGTGLGTSVSWEINANGHGTICNDFFPEAEIPRMEFEISGIDQLTTLSMRFMSDLDNTEKSEKICKLKTVIDAYGTWIDSLEKKKESVGQYLKAAEANISGCRAAHERMLNGLKILEDDELAWKAFMLANRAMFMQRVHLTVQQETANEDRYPNDSKLGEILRQMDYADSEGKFTKNVHSWRPFQIAFMLMSIGSITDDFSPERRIVDLIWFPTGGGKTEAYLGLTAFTIFYRRLAHAEESSGTAVIMRYTLRLLTAQQFTRASTLICACEYIRVDAMSESPRYGKYQLGNAEINIGLWIGRDHTPNTYDEAKKCLEKLIHAKEDLQICKEKFNKFQVLKCPWCGTKMVKDRVGGKTVGSFGYTASDRHFALYCPHKDCFYNQRDRLPLQVVDDELYKNPPTLLFGTVDKFAMIPWKGETKAFFGTGSKNRPPDLIIQDELHLISGPLGTMVGLYESIVDALCGGGNGMGPKIVVSTATIRKAKEQCSALYNREVSQFPHPGLDADDSFFAKEIAIDYENGKYGRKYVGLMPAGKTKVNMESRSIAALMQGINTMDIKNDEVKDKFWTLTVYFNSLRDLGKASTLVYDSVKDDIRRIAYRLGNMGSVRKFKRPDELTSRVITTALNETLDKLEKVKYSAKKNENGRYPSDILLATNMISVGIDIARLNVMLLVGQPKLTSEYIQASSRIGREFPGVAFVMYDGAKSRDRSHYEQFRPYHESFYKFVEPTSATPFAKPARDRALHAVVIAILRMLESELNSENGATAFTREKYSTRLAEVKEQLINRAEKITIRQNPDMKFDSESMREEIDLVFKIWENLTKDFPGHLCYGVKYMFGGIPEDGVGRLMKPYNKGRNDDAIETMTSMRNVDSAVCVSVLIPEE